MHSKQLAELGAWIAIAARNCEKTFQFRSQAYSDLYWICSKRRLTRWNSALGLFRSDLENPSENHSPWHALSVVTEEIFLSEVLTRIWSAVLLNGGKRAAGQQGSLIAQSIVVGHIEASNQAQKIILEFAANDDSRIERLFQLRRQTGRWTDLFLSFLPNVEQSAQLGHDSDRVRDFAEDERSRSINLDFDPQQLSAVTFQTAISQLTGKLSSNPDLNRNIAVGIMSSLSTNTLPMEISPSHNWQLRMESSQIDVQLLLDQLMDEEGSSRVI